MSLFAFQFLVLNNLSLPEESLEQLDSYGYEVYIPGECLIINRHVY